MKLDMMEMPGKNQNRMAHGVGPDATLDPEPLSYILARNEGVNPMFYSSQKKTPKYECVNKVGIQTFLVD